MTGQALRRVPRPVLLLLVVLGALLAPATPSSAAPGTAAVVRHVPSSHAAPSRAPSGRAEHHRDATSLTAATAQAPAPAHSTPAADRRPPAPRLLLVQRPRPPTSDPARRATGAPTGRSPPSPAGT